MTENRETIDQLGLLLKNIIDKGKAGASLQEVMDELQQELPKITSEDAD